MATKKLSMSEKNKKFWALSPEKQRVAIAKDVLAQIEMKKIKPSTGEYFSIEELKTDIKEVPQKLDVLFLELNKQNATCEVCGIGSCFVGLVNLGNNVETKECFSGDIIETFDRIDETSMRKLLRKVFSPRQLTMIECAFERDYEFRDGSDSWEDSLKDRKRSETFGKRYKTDKNRLKAIMENIIKNKGEFKP